MMESVNVGIGKQISLALALAVFGLSWSGTAAQAETFRLGNPSDSVVGFPFYFTARNKDTLMDIARQNNLGFADMRQAIQKRICGCLAKARRYWYRRFMCSQTCPTSALLSIVPKNGCITSHQSAPTKSRFLPSAWGAMRWARRWVPSKSSKKRKTRFGRRANVRASHAARGDILPAQVPPGQIIRWDALRCA